MKDFWAVSIFRNLLKPPPHVPRNLTPGTYLTKTSWGVVFPDFWPLEPGIQQHFGPQIRILPKIQSPKPPRPIINLAEESRPQANLTRPISIGKPLRGKRGGSRKKTAGRGFRAPSPSPSPRPSYLDFTAVEPELGSTGKLLRTEQIRIARAPPPLRHASGRRTDRK